MIEQKALRNDIIDEVIRVFGLPANWFNRVLFSPLFGPPSNQFAKIGVEFDTKTALEGFYQAAKDLIPRFIHNINVRGQEYIPQRGPLLIVSNHPGAYDSLVISSHIPRDDYKIVVGNIQFLKLLPNASRHFIFSPALSETQGRASVVRSSIQHLKDGGALLIFPSGQVDPDPAVLPGALQALSRWSRSILLMLRAVPQANLMMTFVSGVLEKKHFNNPLTRLRQDEMEKRRLAEFIQVMRQLVLNEDRITSTQLSFTPPIKAELFQNLHHPLQAMEEIRQRASDSLIDHIEYWKSKINGYFGDIGIGN